MDVLRFTASVGNVAASRQWVVAWARRNGCPEASVRTLALLTTEAVTNAVEHGPAGGEVSVAVSVVDGGWRVAVSDESSADPVLQEVGPEAMGGRGVMLIDRLASEWGVDHLNGTGKTVWFGLAEPE